MKNNDIPCYGGINDRFDYDRMKKHRELKPRTAYLILALCAILPVAVFLMFILK